jgi:hypothetical protein
MRNAAFTMLGWSFLFLLGVTLMPMTMLRIMVMAVIVGIERVVKNLMGQRNDVEA